MLESIPRLPLSDQTQNMPCTLSNDDFNNLTTQLQQQKTQQGTSTETLYDGTF